MTLFVANKPLAAVTTDITANILDLNDAPHTFVTTNFRQILWIENNEAVPLTITLLGQGVTTAECPGVGSVTLADVDNNIIVVAASATVAINIDRLASYMGAVGNTVDVTVAGSTAPSLGFAWLNEY